MAYGSPAGVAAYSVWTENGEFVDPTDYVAGTKPTLTQVNTFLAAISVMVDLALGSEGFTFPVTQPDALLLIDEIVNMLASDLVNAANQSGRFFTERVLETGKGQMAIINADILAWVVANTDGLVAMGVPHTVDEGDQGAFSIQMTRAGSSSTEEFARPRFLIRP
jgi:hypothetical protein